MKIIPSLIASVLLALQCGSKSDNSGGTAASTASTSASISINVSGAAANNLIALSVINENTRRSVSGYNFDFTSGGDKADATGQYTKTVTGLTAEITYTIVVRSDVNGDILQDTNDKGQILTGITSGSTASLTNLQVLSTLGATASTNAALASKTAGCTLYNQNYQAGDLTAGTSIGYAGAVAIFYNGAGVPTISAGHFPPGTYSNIMCAIDMNGNQVMDAGDKYQFVIGPTNLPAGDDSTTFAVGAWSTY
jgi:hypothetical protein